jgi:hypothetical protein
VDAWGVLRRLLRLEASIAGMKKGPAGPLHDAGVDAGQSYEVGVSIDWILHALGRAQMNDTPPGANNEYSRGPRPSRGESSPAQRSVSARPAGDRGGLVRRLWGGDRGGAEGVGEASSDRLPDAGSDPIRDAGSYPIRDAGSDPIRDAGSDPIRDARSAAIRSAILGSVLVGCLLLLVAEFTSLFTVHLETSATTIKTVTTGSHHSYALIPIALLAAALAIGVFRDASRAALLAIGLLGIVTLLIAVLGDLPDAHATGLSGSSTTHLVTASSTPAAGLYLETLGAAVLVITSGVAFIALGPAPARHARSRPAAPPWR